MDFAAQILGEMPKLSSVFVGGGTPSLFSAAQISALLNGLESRFGLDTGCEVTLEANPESTSPDYLAALVETGVNRLSMGVQSFDPAVLKTLDRQHQPTRVAPLVAEAKNLGLVTSIDLIYGAPGESLASSKQMKTSMPRSTNLRLKDLAAPVWNGTRFLTGECRQSTTVLIGSLRTGGALVRVPTLTSTATASGITSTQLHTKTNWLKPPR